VRKNLEVNGILYEDVLAAYMVGAKNAGIEHKCEVFKGNCVMNGENWGEVKRRPRWDKTTQVAAARQQAEAVKLSGVSVYQGEE